MSDAATLELRDSSDPTYGPSVPTFGERLRSLREAKGLSLQDAAKASGLTRNNWWQYEAGKRDNPSLAVIASMARALDVKVSYLLQTVDTFPGDP